MTFPRAVLDLENRNIGDAGEPTLGRYRSLAPSGLTASDFEGRGAYGDYFAGQVGVRGGYGCPTVR